MRSRGPNNSAACLRATAVWPRPKNHASYYCEYLLPPTIHRFDRGVSYKGGGALLLLQDVRCHKEIGSHHQRLVASKCKAGTASVAEIRVQPPCKPLPQPQAIPNSAGAAEILVQICPT